MRRRLIPWIIFAASMLPLAAQYTPGVRWKQIKTRHFQVIFPEELERDARRAVLLSEEYYRLNAYGGTRHPYRRWPLVLTNRNTTPNGFVDFLNQRSVWFSTPLIPVLGAGEWYGTLALHEGRHIAQAERLKRGILYGLFLSMGNIAISSFNVNPPWFVEGDGIDRETMLSSAGRGRDPRFHRGMEAIVLEGNFDYQKVKNGSFRDKIPDHYHLGYPLVAYTRSRYGEESWDEFMDGTTWLPLPILGPVLGTHIAAKRAPHTLYEEMVDQWSRERREEMEKEAHTDVEALSPEAASFVTYDSLTSLPGGAILARRKSMNTPSMLVRLANGKETFLRQISDFTPLVFGRRWVASIESVPDIRFDWAGSSELVITNLEGGRRRSLSSGKRYLDLALNRGETEIAAVNFGQDRRAALVFFDMKSGAEKKEIPFPEGVIGFSPSYNAEGNRLVLVVQNNEGLGLAEIDLQEAAPSLRMILPYSNELIRNPVYGDGGFLFSSNYNGREAIYLLSEGGRRRLIAQRPYTAVEPVVDVGGDGFYYVEFSGLKGDRVVKAAYPEKGAQASPENRLNQTVVASFGLEEGKLPTPAAVEPSPEAMSSLEMEDYHPGANLFRFQYLGLHIDDPFSPPLNGGASSLLLNLPSLNTSESLILSLNSQDPLGILNLRLLGKYYLNEKTFGGGFRARLNAFFPVFSLGGDYSYRKPENEEFHQVAAGFGVTLPLNFSQGLWSTKLDLSAEISSRFTRDVDEISPWTASFPLTYELDFFHILRGSQRSLLPKLGFALRGDASHTPMENQNKYRLAGRFTGYLPGIFRNTSLRLNAGWEEQNGNYESVLPEAKGYPVLSGDLIHLEGGFHFPLFYPDLPLGPVMYFKRLRGEVFGQMTWRDGEEFFSAGGQLELDFTLGDVMALFSLGMRASYLFGEDEMSYQLLLMGGSIREL